jgi:hypothetical protein
MAGLEAEETKITAIVLLRFVDVRTKVRAQAMQQRNYVLVSKDT